MYLKSKFSIAMLKPVFALVKKPTPKTYTGNGKVKEIVDILNELSVLTKKEMFKKVLVVTDEVLFNLGLLDEMLKVLENNDIETVVFKGVLPDPTFSVVNAGLRVSEGCEAVIAFGGGSVIDAAKVIAAASTNGKSPKKLQGLLKVKNPTLPFIAIPTTAGTGSECTLAAVISDDVTHQKLTVVDPKVVPSAAILDANITAGLPQSITVFTAMDALTHAVEAYVSKFANKKTDVFAKSAIKDIFTYLPKVFEEPSDLEAREKLLIASFDAGRAFTRTYIGYVHSFAHSIGGLFGVPHGKANAILLPTIMNDYQSEKRCRKRFAELSDLLLLSDANDSIDQKSEKFIITLKEMNKNLNVPEKFTEFRASDIDKIIVGAFKETHGKYPVPKYLKKQDAKVLLEQLC